MDETPDILLQIARDRTERIRRYGPEQGLMIPDRRSLPLVDFHRLERRAEGNPEAGTPGSGQDGPTGKSTETPAEAPGILIAEVKRKSPSKGAIAEIPEPASLAARYAEAGFRRVSVLTEEERFGGSLADLMAVKNALPDLAVLRKDFLLSVEDVEVSYRAGADAILLIATLLEGETLDEMYRRALELGLCPLVEVHAQSDVDKVRHLAPPLIGINSRDLRRFRVEPLLPLETRSSIDWPCDVVYESGIAGPDDALFVKGTGFAGFLVGESVARSPDLARDLISAWERSAEARRRYGAWARLYERYTPGIPLVKICGLTDRSDARAAVDAGADLLGFVMAESPRKVDADLIRSCRDLPLQKAAVVVLEAGKELPPEVADLLEDGSLDFIQFHGDESPDMLRRWPSYKALNLKAPQDAGVMTGIGSPAVLVDAFSPDARGGTGKRLDPELVEAATEKRRLWIAGGLNPENIRDIVSTYSPGLVDVSTGVAADDGVRRVKDHEKIRRFVSEAKNKRSPHER